MCLGVENLTLRRDSVAAGEAISTLLATGIVLDVVFQLVFYHSVHPGPAWVVGRFSVASLTRRPECSQHA
jgi:hypothetical protein